MNYRTDYMEMIKDPLDLYIRARTKRDSSLPKEVGTWIGHHKQYTDIRDKLKKIIALAKYLGCEIDPIDETWQDGEPPESPWK